MNVDTYKTKKKDGWTMKNDVARNEVTREITTNRQL